jgi:hypothetical protein
MTPDATVATDIAEGTGRVASLPEGLDYCDLEYVGMLDSVDDLRTHGIRSMRRIRQRDHYCCDGDHSC